MMGQANFDEKIGMAEKVIHGYDDVPTLRPPKSTSRTQP